MTDYVVPIPMFEAWVQELGLPADTECIEKWGVKWWKDKMIETGFQRPKGTSAEE